MKTILVPTDFSDPANNALDYAAQLAHTLKARLLLMHVFWTPVYEFDSRQETQAKEKDFREYAQQQLAQTEKRILSNYPELQLEIVIRNGLSTPDEIVRIAHIHRAFLLVMGTKGASRLEEILIGSNTLDVIEKAECPVLAIPENARWQGIQHIVAAVDHHDSDITALYELTELAERYHAQITVLHQTDEEHAIAEQTILRQLTQQVRKQTAYPNIKYTLLEGDNLVEALDEYIDQHSTDILAMSTRKQSVFSRVFGKSYTKKMMQHTRIPLLAFQVYDLPNHTV